MTYRCGALQYAVLQVLWRDGGWLTLGDIRELGQFRGTAHWANIGRTADRLAVKGFVLRRQHPPSFARHRRRWEYKARLIPDEFVATCAENPRDNEHASEVDHD